MYTTWTHLLLIYSFVRDLARRWLIQTVTYGRSTRKQIFIVTYAINWIILYSQYICNQMDYILYRQYIEIHKHHVERTNLRRGNTSSASCFSLQIYATYITVIFCMVKHTNTTPLSGCSSVVGLMTITDKPCTMWCGDIYIYIYIYIHTHTHTHRIQVTKINPTLRQGKAFSILDVTTYQ